MFSPIPQTFHETLYCLFDIQVDYKGLQDSNGHPMWYTELIISSWKLLSYIRDYRNTEKQLPQVPSVNGIL